MAKKYFRQEGIHFRDVDVSRDMAAARDMIRRSGQQGVPVIDIGGKIVVGFDRAKIDSYLGLKLMEGTVNKINIQPMGARVLIKPIEQDNKTSSGLLLPETAKEKPQTGLFVAVGDDEEIKLKVNDKVLFAKYTGPDFKMDGTEYLLLESTDVLARVLS